MVKAALWNISDAEARKRGEQTGLDTLVVHALNYDTKCRRFTAGAAANAISIPPGKYGRKVETQRN